MLQQGAALFVHLLGAHPTLHGVLYATARQLLGLLAQQGGLLPTQVAVATHGRFARALLQGFPIFGGVLAQLALAEGGTDSPRRDVALPFGRHKGVDHRQRTHRMCRLERQPALTLGQALRNAQVGVHILLPPHNMQQGIFDFFSSIHFLSFLSFLSFLFYKAKGGRQTARPSGKDV